MGRKKITAIDLFCGAGGLTRGISESGIRVAKGIDMDGTVAETYEKNNPGATFVKADIRRISPAEIMDGIDLGGTDLLIAGCAPCQPFSKHMDGSKRRDSRRSLIMCLADIIGALKPEYVLVENVPGFGRSENRYHREFTKIIKKHGYQYDEKVVNCAEYGVPQSRKRYVLLGAIGRDIRIPSGTYGYRGREFRTVMDAISKYPKISAGVSSDRVPNHSAMRLSESNLKRIRSTPRNGGSMGDIPSRMRTRCHKDHSGHTDTYGRMGWHNPSPTLTCRCNSLSNGRFGHPVQNRAITVREAAALQTFPDDYVFHSSDTRNAAHVGNAVPVVLARVLGRAIVDR